MTLVLINIFIIASTALVCVLCFDMIRNIYLTEKSRYKRKKTLERKKNAKQELSDSGLCHSKGKSETGMKKESFEKYYLGDTENA